MTEFTLGTKVRDSRDGKEYIVVKLRPCGEKVDCEYVGCKMVKNGMTITTKIKKEFLEVFDD